MPRRIFYAAGPGDIIAAHQHWKDGRDDPSQMSLTYSSQFEEMCKDLDLTAYLVSSHQSPRLLHDEHFTLEHRPKNSLRAGLSYHLSEIAYGLSLLMTAIRFRADLAVISSGTTHYFVLSLFRLFSIRVITVLHNTLWPKGHPPARLTSRAIAQLDGLFFRFLCDAVVGVSPECTTQVVELTRHQPCAVYVMYPQFRREFFERIRPVADLPESPFRILFAGRAERNKGIFDLLEIARMIEDRLPGSVRWDICGAGSDLEELIQRHQELQLESVVEIHGWTSPVDLRDIQGNSHLSIVPTRSDFAEGMAKTAIEAILAGRAILASSVTPALETLRPAAIEARTDDLKAYVDEIIGLVTNRGRYLRLVEASHSLQELFYDRNMGFSASLKRAMNNT